MVYIFYQLFKRFSFVFIIFFSFVSITLLNFRLVLNLFIDRTVSETTYKRNCMRFIFGQIIQTIISQCPQHLPKEMVIKWLTFENNKRPKSIAMLF